MVIFVIMIVSAILVVGLVIYFLSESNKSTKTIDKLIEQTSREMEEANADNKGDKDLKIMHHKFKFFDRDVF
jgi:hypothetical protein